MRTSRRRLWAALLARVWRRGGLATCAVLFTLVGAVAARAGEGSLKGAEMNGFGRIALEFDQPVKVSARVANGILVVSFSEPVSLRAERLVAELPSYVSIVRRDPDGTALRVGLTKPFRPNLLEAGERVFIDLLPENWTGLPPGLPPDVVADLARRARDAESQIREASRRRLSDGPKPLAVRVAQLPTLARAVFTAPSAVPVTFRANGSEVSLHFDAALTLEAGKLKAELAPAVRAASAQPGKASLVVKLTLEPGYEARGFREDETFVLDLMKPKAVDPVVSEAIGPQADEGESTAAGRSPPRPPGPTAPSSASASGPAPAADASAAKPVPAAEAPPPTPPPATPPIRPVTPGPVRPTVTMAPDGLRMMFPFANRTAAAAFERGGLVTLVFHTPDLVETPSLPAEAMPYATRADVTRDGRVVVVRVTLSEPQLIRLAPEDERWVLTIGDKGLIASEALTVSRRADQVGLIGLSVPLVEASGVHWLREPHSGDRLAVATAFGPSRTVTKPQAFVEFRLLATAHGVVVAADADDLTVTSNPKAVFVGRPSGLALSMPTLLDAAPGTRSTGQLLITRTEWRNDQLGNVLERYRGLMRAAVDAPGSGISQARVDLARFLMAAGLNAEAAGILDAAMQQDPVLQRQNTILLLRGIAAVRTRRVAQARKILSAESLVDEPEAVLWRAVLDAQDRRWRSALTGFQRSNLVLDLYPDDLQGEIRMLAARAGLEMQDPPYAENELTAIGLLPADAYSSQEATLLRGRLEEAAGRLDLAADLYRKAAIDPERPAAAEATLRWVSLALRTGSMQRDEAIARLETLSFVWRGDEVEITTIGQLGRLYAESGRWREAFIMATRADRLFPDHEISRTLHEEAGRLFHDVFLSQRGEALSRVEALALYFDFKQFTPIGRRGDEIVRKLADRLLELDLLEQASELLQHQVDNRLTGAARATVAARLATVRLMDNKPAAALAVLHATRLPELPVATKRARLLLEARALSDLTRTDLAMEVLQGEVGPEIDRLRADILWTGRRWREAGEAHEGLAGTRWQAPHALSDRDRLDVQRAAVAYTLGNERLALDRLRAKFAAKMADSADARTFAFLTQPNIANTRAFRDIARNVVGTDTLADFLAEYRKRYPDAAAADRRRVAPDAAPGPEQPARPQAQRAPEGAPAPNG